MPVRISFLMAWVILVSIAGRAFAENYVLRMPRTVDISGTSVLFDGSISYAIPEKSCEPIPITFVVPLDDLNAKLIKIVKSTGIEKDQECGDRLEIHGAHLSADGGNLGAKVEGKVGRQECVKTKVPVFHGIEVTFENKIVASTTIDTDAGIEAVFDPVILNGALTAVLLGEPKLNVSNDILRGIAELFQVDNQLRDKIAEAIQKALAEPGAALQLPPTLAGFTFAFDDARADIVDGRLSLVITATSPRNQNLIGTFLSYLSEQTGTQVAAASCH